MYGNGFRNSDVPGAGLPACLPACLGMFYLLLCCEEGEGGAKEGGGRGRTLGGTEGRGLSNLGLDRLAAADSRLYLVLPTYCTSVVQASPTSIGSLLPYVTQPMSLVPSVRTSIPTP